MQSRIAVIVSLAATLFASPVRAVQPDNEVPAAPAVADIAQESTAEPDRRPIVWYNDPVSIAIGILLLFVLVDLGVMAARGPDRNRLGTSR